MKSDSSGFKGKINFDLQWKPKCQQIDLQRL